jgi:hypothetical protein
MNESAKQPMAVLGQKREHATGRNQLPNHRLGVQQLPLGTRRTLHSKIIPANQAPSRQTRRPPTDLFSGVLGTAAMAASRTKDTTYLGARYHRLTPRLGKKKAIVALEHSILTAVWHMLTHDVDYHDLGGDYFTRLNPERAMKRTIRQANALGFTVRFDPIEAA